MSVAGVRVVEFGTYRVVLVQVRFWLYQSIPRRRRQNVDRLEHIIIALSSSDRRTGPFTSTKSAHCAVSVLALTRSAPFVSARRPPTIFPSERRRRRRRPGDAPSLTARRRNYHRRTARHGRRVGRNPVKTRAQRFGRGSMTSEASYVHVSDVIVSRSRVHLARCPFCRRTSSCEDV